MSSLTFACVIPTHFRPAFLSEALESVLLQTRPFDQVIVVSDVVDAEAEAVCARFAQMHPQISLVFEAVADPPGGASASRNRGAALAHADVIGFLDDDDLWRPELLAAVERRFSEEPTDMVVVSREIFSESASYPGPRIVDGLRPKDVAAASLGTTGSNMLMTRAAFDAIGGFDSQLPVKNDTDFFLRFLLAGYAYATIQTDLVRQRKHGLGQLTSKNERRAAGTEMYIRKHAEHLTRSDLRKLRLTIHRIRRTAATSRGDRLRHLMGALANYRPSDFIRERREWNMWHHQPDSSTQG